MLKRAMAVAGPEAIYEWQTICKWYRSEQSTPILFDAFTGEVTQWTTGIGATLVGKKRAVQHFCSLYRSMNRDDAKGLVATIQKRNLLADVDVAFRQVCCSYSERGGGPQGKTASARARKELFGLLWPGWDSISKPSSNPLTKSDYKYFSTILARSKSWAIIRAGLGPSALGLMPLSKIPDVFIERSPIPRLGVWIELVKKYNHRFMEISEIFAAKLLTNFIFADNIGPAEPTRLSRKRLKLERMSGPDIRSENLSWPTLFDDEDELVQTSGDDEVGPAQRGRQVGQSRLADQAWSTELLDVGLAGGPGMPAYGPISEGLEGWNAAQ